MTNLYSISGRYDGRLITTRLVIPPDAHEVGVTGFEYVRHYIVKEDEMYCAEGADIIWRYAHLMADTMRKEYTGAWETTKPLF